MKKKELPIKFPEQYLPRLSELCIQKDVSPSVHLINAGMDGFKTTSVEGEQTYRPIVIGHYSCPF